jgi:predicted RNase H-like nuclease (RuvC/YqgF family)
VTWPEQAVTIVVAIIGALAVSSGAYLVDRRVRGAERQARRAERMDWEAGAALRAQQMDGETVARLRAEIARLDDRLDECADENTSLRRQLTAAVKRVATLEDTLRTNHITVPATGRSGGP